MYHSALILKPSTSLQTLNQRVSESSHWCQESSLLAHGSQSGFFVGRNQRQGGFRNHDWGQWSVSCLWVRVRETLTGCEQVCAIAFASHSSLDGNWLRMSRGGDRLGDVCDRKRTGLEDCPIQIGVMNSSRQRVENTYISVVSPPTPPAKMRLRSFRSYDTSSSWW